MFGISRSDEPGRDGTRVPMINFLVGAPIDINDHHLDMVVGPSRGEGAITVREPQLKTVSGAEVRSEGLDGGRDGTAPPPGAPAVCIFDLDRGGGGRGDPRNTAAPYQC